MSYYHCLSGNGDCKEVCQACKDSIDNYYKRAEDLVVMNAIDVLTSRGYTVIKPVAK
jgi:hypothetical protein